MARRAAEWRDPSSSPASLLLFSCLLVAVADHSPKFCHPDRSGPISSFAPNYGASGRGVEGSLFLPASLFAFLLPPGRWSLTTLPNSVIPTGAARFLPSRRTMARRAAEWRDPSGPYRGGHSWPALSLEGSDINPPKQTLSQILSSRPERPDFFLRAELWRVGPRSGGNSLPPWGPEKYPPNSGRKCWRRSNPLPRVFL